MGAYPSEPPRGCIRRRGAMGLAPQAMAVFKVYKPTFGGWPKAQGPWPPLPGGRYTLERLR